MKIGYVPSSPDFSHPSDRRKFFRYLSIRDLYYEKASFDSVYDILYVSIKTDLTLWSRYKQVNDRAKTKIIFDLSDSYLDEPYLSNIIRSVYHYLSGRSKYIKLSYASTIMDMISCSDILLCGSPEQKIKLDLLHSNVVVVRDYFDIDINDFKKNYNLVKSNDLHILWEGYSHGNKSIFIFIKDILAKIDSKFNVHMHVVSDNRYCVIGGKYLCRCTNDILQHIFKHTSVTVHSYDWSSITFSSIASSCDFAIIPIPRKPRMWSKPENKLLLLWSVGLPVLTTDTPSYVRVMREIGMDMTCSDIYQWRDKIRSLTLDRSLRLEYMSKVSNYMKNSYNENIITQIWDSIIR